MEQEPERDYQWNNMTVVEKTILVCGAVLGYLVGWYLRAEAGKVGAVPGAIYGGLGTGAGVLIGYLVIWLIRKATK